MSPVLARQYTTIAGLVLLVYDHIITWDRELNRIWRGRGWALKVMFCLGRYWALAFQIINLIVTHPHILKNPAMNCRLWFHFQNGAVAVSLINLQILLMLRVYALYDCSTKMACFLCSWFVFYTVMTFFSSKEVTPLLKLDSDCILVEAPHVGSMMSFGALCILDQSILWGLTAHKYRHSIRLGLARNPIFRLVMRDTSLSFLAICCLFITTVPYSMVIKASAPAFHSLLCSLVSILVCRTILNMRGLSNPDGPLSIDVATMDLELTNLTEGE